MKLSAKLTAICASVLLLMAAVLSALMLWQVREQSYHTLAQRSIEQLNAVTSAFVESVNQKLTDYESQDALNAYLRYQFRNCGGENAALAVDGELVSAPVPIDPRSYLDVHLGNGVRSARFDSGKNHYLIVGNAYDWRQSEFQIYLAADASYIHRELSELLSRFLLTALCACSIGLASVFLLIRHTLHPLSLLQKSAECIASGHFDQRVSIVARDEVGELAAHFNQMAEAVEVHVHSLTEQNTRQHLFISSVTHEFKTPLTSLLLNVDTLRNVFLTEEKQQELLEAMDSQLHWLEQMVHKLLKLLSLRQSAQLRFASVPALLEQVRILTAGTMRKYGTNLDVQCTVERLPMDPDLLCSALVNLVENSAKASSSGQIIRLCAHGNCLEVSDSGQGIPQTDLERVTEPFFMGDPSRSKQKGGFGLGLALVKEIASVHNARLDIQSQPGKGTCIRLIFPENGNQTVM